MACCDICVIILCFIYVQNAISDAHTIYGSTTLLTNIEYTDLILEITGKYIYNETKYILKLHHITESFALRGSTTFSCFFFIIEPRGLKFGIRM